jgi:hypothetical protein
LSAMYAPHRSLLPIPWSCALPYVAPLRKHADFRIVAAQFCCGICISIGKQTGKLQRFRSFYMRLRYCDVRMCELRKVAKMRWKMRRFLVCVRLHIFAEGTEPVSREIGDPAARTAAIRCVLPGKMGCVLLDTAFGGDTMGKGRKVGAGDARSAVEGARWAVVSECERYG